MTMTVCLLVQLPSRQRRLSYQEMIADTHQESSAEFDAMLRMGVHATLAGSDFKQAFEHFLAELLRQAPAFAAQIPVGAEVSSAQSVSESDRMIFRFVPIAV